MGKWVVVASIIAAPRVFRHPHAITGWHSLEQFVTSAIADKISALTTEDYLQERAKRGDRAKYEAVLAKVADVPLAAESRSP
jgi:hypothetical protein